MIRRLGLSALVATAVAGAIAGCEKAAVTAPIDAGAPAAVRVVRPESRDIVRIVQQPGFVDAYEQTAIYPKMTAYLEKWNVDIGDRVKKDDVLATLFVPELLQEHETKKADVGLARNLVAQAGKLLDVAKAEVAAAEAEVAEAQSNLGTYQAAVDRWTSEVARLTKDVEAKVISRQVLDESRRQLDSSTASRDAAQSGIAAASAKLLASQAAVAKAEVDIEVEQARVKVSEAEERRLAALVGYLQLTAPYDGIIVARNANTGDFVLPATGDPSASTRAPDVSSSKAAPIYVVARTDLMRIYVDVPERDANHVTKGSKASVLARAFRDEELPATVTRTSWSLNVTSRTLRAEIDLPNPDEKLLPGMYAYGRIHIERPGVRAIPVAALDASGERDYCWRVEDGKAVRNEIETGVSDGEWVEVTNRRVAPTDEWTPFDGTEEVIVGDLASLVEGEPVKVTPDQPAAPAKAVETAQR